MKIEVRSPFDRSLLATLDAADSGAVDRALEIAHGLFRDRDRWLSVAARIDVLRETARRMEAQAEHLAVEAAREGGMPLVV